MYIKQLHLSTHVHNTHVQKYNYVHKFHKIHDEENSTTLTLHCFFIQAARKSGPNLTVTTLLTFVYWPFQIRPRPLEWAWIILSESELLQNPTSYPCDVPEEAGRGETKCKQWMKQDYFLKSFYSLLDHTTTSNVKHTLFTLEPDWWRLRFNPTVNLQFERRLREPGTDVAVTDFPDDVTDVLCSVCVKAYPEPAASYLHSQSVYPGHQQGVVVQQGGTVIVTSQTVQQVTLQHPRLHLRVTVGELVFPSPFISVRPLGGSIQLK